ncbi:MAG: response regulator [Lachnospiraceae bacterium]|nr:response regulator [Lachnospiraceae bacterium]
MKVLLADDSPLILERFVKMVDWKKHGFHVLTAVDGKKALLEFQKHRPELVITDIQMPKMSGIELAKQIKLESPDTILFFLTSYEEFSYVKSGLELGIHGYLLKHETHKENLEELLEEVKREIKKRKLRARYTAEAALHELIQDLENHPDAAGEEKYSISLPDSYDMFWLEQDHIYPVLAEIFHVKKKKLDGKAVMASCYQLIPDLAAVIQTDEWSYLCLLKSKVSITETVYELKKELLRQYHETFSILVISDQVSITACADKYLRSIEVRSQKIFNTRSLVTHASYISWSRPVSQPLDFKKADDLLKDRQFEKLYTWIDINYMQTLEARDYKRFEQLTRYLATRLLEYHDQIVDFQTGMSFITFSQVDYESWYDANSIYQWLRQKIADLAHLLEQPMIFSYSSLVNQAVEFVKKNYSDPELSVEMIADRLKISANYLNAIFKKETGETIWKLVIKVRMERARELLNMGDDRMTEICKKTGYSNMSYFSKVFKETYGMSPLEYRRKNHED